MTIVLFSLFHTFTHRLKNACAAIGSSNDVHAAAARFKLVTDKNHPMERVVVALRWLKGRLLEQDQRAEQAPFGFATILLSARRVERLRHAAVSMALIQQSAEAELSKADDCAEDDIKSDKEQEKELKQLVSGMNVMELVDWMVSRKMQMALQ